jgi:tight adherence protein C
MILLITLSTFVFIMLAVMSVYWLLYRPQSASTQRLQQLGGSANGSVMGGSFVEDPIANFAEKVAEPLNRLVPVSATEAKKLQKQLMQAGYRGHNAPIIFRGIQVAALGGFPGVMTLACMTQGYSINNSIIYILLTFVAGFFLPRYILRRMIRGRQQRVQWGMADSLDLLVVSLEAGLGLNSAMVKVSQELKQAHPDISDEFELANLEIRVGRDRDEALRNLAERTGVDDLRSFVAMLIQADRFGTSIAKAVRVYSDSLRTKRRQRAEQAAQKAAVKLLFPLAFFLFPTLFIVILGPAGLNLIDTMGNM